MIHPTHLITVCRGLQYCGLLRHDTALSLPASSELKKNLLYSSKMSVPSKHTTRCHTPDDHNIIFSPAVINPKLRKDYFMFCWPCISIQLCNDDQLAALFILSLFRQSTSICFGLICSPSSGGILHICNNWYVLCFFS